MLFSKKIQQLYQVSASGAADKWSKWIQIGVQMVVVDMCWHRTSWCWWMFIPWKMEVGLIGVQTYLDLPMICQWSSFDRMVWPYPSNNQYGVGHWLPFEVPATSPPSRQASTVKLPQVLRKGMDRNNKLPLFRAENATWISWCPLWPGFTQERIRTAPKNDRKPIRNKGGSHLNWLWLFGCSGRQGLKCIMWIYTSNLRWFWGRF